MLGEKPPIQLRTPSDTFRYAPYAKATSCYLSARAEALFTALNKHCELPTDRLMENVLEAYAKQVLPEGTYTAISIELPFTVKDKHDQRYILSLANVLKDELREHLFTLCAFAVDSSPTETRFVENDELQKALGDMMYVYYNTFVGKCPPHIMYQERPFLHRAFVSENVNYDARADHDRQISLHINLSPESITFVAPSPFGDTRMVLHPGDGIMFPSNFTCAYRWETEGDKLGLASTFMHHAPQGTE